MIGDRLKKDEKFDSIYVYLPLNKIILQFKIIYSTQIFKHFIAVSLYLCEFELFLAIFYELVG